MEDRSSESGDYTSEDEGTEDYWPGSYYPVQIGDSFKSGLYVVQRCLGSGCFSTVWLAEDTHRSQDVALKVLRSAREAARDEIEILQRIAAGDPKGKKCVVKLLDHFRLSGPNGERVCMVFECLGDDLSKLIERLGECNCGLRIAKVKEICFHFLVGLDYLHRELSIIHDDLKPENVLLSRIDLPSDLASVDLKCKLVDFGKARQTNIEFPDDPQSGAYRCPELILGSKSSTSADLWSFACICFELATGDVLFDGDSGDNEGHLALMMKLLGKMPRQMASKLKNKGFYDGCGYLIKIASGAPFLRDFFDRCLNKSHSLRSRIQRLKKKLLEEHEFSEQDATDMADFLGRILDFDPNKRPTAAECLQHQWITQR